MRKSFSFAIAVFAIIALPAMAEAAGIFDVIVNAITGCSGSAFGSTCDANSGMLFSTIACKVMQTIDSAIIPIYCNITQNPDYVAFLNAVLLLYVVLYGVGYLAGMHKAKLGEMMVALIKLLLVYTLLSNAGFFFTFIYKAVVDTPQQLVQTLLAGKGSGSSNIFEYIDQGMYKIFDEASQPALAPEDRQTYIGKELTIFALAIGMKSMMPGGNFVYGLFMFVVMGWLFSYLMIVVRYLLSYMSIVFMLMLAPLFLPTILFQRTNFLFHQWTRMLASFMLEIVIVVAFVLMIEPFYVNFYDMLKKSFNGLQLEKEDTTYLKTYNNGTDTNYVKQENVQGIKDPAKALNKAGYSGDATQLSADFMIQLVSMAVIIFMSSVFLRYIPTFASMLAGMYNDSKTFGGMSMAQGGKGGAKLYGQAGAGNQTVSNKEKIDEGNAQSFISSMNPFS